MAGRSTSVRDVSVEPEHREPQEAVGTLWVFEVYRTVISVLQGLAGVLLIFFIVALIAFVVIRAVELRRAKA